MSSITHWSNAFITLHYLDMLWTHSAPIHKYWLAAHDIIRALNARRKKGRTNRDPLREFGGRRPRPG